jgi:lsr operon transcriptional repressor
MVRPGVAQQPEDEREARVADPEEALRLRAAWLYFIGQQTQAEIADALGTTRFRVNRLLAECRAEGLVRVEVTAPLASCVALERAAMEAFGLSDAVVVPSPLDPDRTYPMLGAGLARFLSGRLADPALKVLGIGWGQTMREALRHLRASDRPDMHIVTLLGALPRSSEENSIEIIGRLGRMLGAERTYMTAPIYADTPEARYVIAGQRFFSEVQSLILRADLACFSAGDLSPDSLLIRHGLPRGVAPEALREAGAVGDLLGTFIDIDGRAIDHPVNRQLIGPSLTDLKGMRSLVLAAGGTRKLDVVTGALRSGLIDVLVTDEATMRAALARAGGRGCQEPAGGPDA